MFDYHAMHRISQIYLWSWLSRANISRRHIDAVWRHKMNANDDMKVVFVVNYMARQQIAVEFLSMSLVYGADNWFLKIEEQELYLIVYLTAEWRLETQITASGSQRMDPAKSALKYDDEPVA